MGTNPHRLRIYGIWLCRRVEPGLTHHVDIGISRTSFGSKANVQVVRGLLVLVLTRLEGQIGKV